MVFIPYTQLDGTLYIEFQYYKQDDNVIKEYKCWELDSLYVDMGESEDFFLSYTKYIEKPVQPRKFDPYGVNYYDKSLTDSIIKSIKAEQPKDWRTLVMWLDKAANVYNGFFILGI